MSIVKEILTAVIGTVAFSAMLYLPKSKIIYVLFGSLITASAYAILFRFGVSILISTILSAFLGSLYSEIIARLKRTPSTVILLPSTIPLLPGGSLYYTMFYFINYNKKQFLSYLKETAEIGFGIALGILIVVMLLEFYRFYKKALKEKTVL